MFGIWLGSVRDVCLVSTGCCQGCLRANGCPAGCGVQYGGVQCGGGVARICIWM